MCIVSELAEKKLGLSLLMEHNVGKQEWDFDEKMLNTVIDALMECITENSPRTAMGMIADTFRQREGVVTGSGVIRTSGWGLHGEEAVTGGLDYVFANGGKALLSFVVQRGHLQVHCDALCGRSSVSRNP